MLSRKSSGWSRGVSNLQRLHSLVRTLLSCLSLPACPSLSLVKPELFEFNEQEQRLVPWREQPPMAAQPGVHPSQLTNPA